VSRTSARIAAIVVLGLLVAAPSAAAPSHPAARTSLTDVEPDVMCVSCREPLAVAQSPQAIREKAFIQGLVDQGYTKRQIIDALQAQYGPAVLAKPPAHGFNLTIYILPPALVALGIAALAFTLPRWRRRARAAAAAPLATGPSLSDADSQRLDLDLAAWDGQPPPEPSPERPTSSRAP
jgi:cytochrome c-type biogenesis protein CcmH